MEGNERHQLIKEFTRVWGCGTSTAMAWIDAGCRSLEDVRARAEELRLTSMQQCGLKYVDDFEQRISRAQVSAVQMQLRQTVFELLEHMGCQDVELTYCFVTGSYMRGAEDCGDIDLLTCLPPSLGDAPSCIAFLQLLLRRLLADGFLTDDLDPFQHRPEKDGHSATWLGVCRPTGSSFARRFDCKVYPHQHAATAACYFASEHSFNRALRQYATYSCGDKVAHTPGATGLRLGDTLLQPIRKVVRSPGESGEMAHGASVPCSCETDVFEALGLNFVPTHMRVFR